MNPATLLPPQPELDESFDPYVQAALDLERDARLLDLEPWILEPLRHPEQESTFSFVLGTDHGGFRPVSALFVRHSTAAGPAILPVQFAADAYLNGVRAGAQRVSLITALFGLRYGGAAAALVLDPARHSEREVRQAVFNFGSALSDASRHIALAYPAHGNAAEMEWLRAAVLHTPGVQTAVAGGKQSAVNMRAEDSVALGVTELVRCASGSTHAKRVVLQGFSPATSPIAHQLRHDGARIVGVADASGGLHHPLGLDLTQLDSHLQQHEMLLGYPEAEVILNADLLEVDCDVLILAAGERQVSSHNASRIRARVVVELLPHSLTDAARRQLSGEGKTIISDLLCAGPRVLHHLAETSAEPMHVNPVLRRSIRDTWKRVCSAAERWQIPHHDAARTLAVAHVAELLRAQGIN